MSLRACNCRAHRPPLELNAASASAAATPVASPEPPHIAPTRALILQLSRFPAQQLAALQRPPTDAASIALQSLHPHLATLLQLSASMRLAWSAPPAAVCAERAAEEDAERSGAVALRLLGISTAERAASVHRASLLAQARSARRSAGAAPVSPAADYPKMYEAPDGQHARLEIATNHLPLMLAVDRARQGMLHEAAVTGQKAAVTHCNQPVFLATQQPDGAANCIAPFLPLPTPSPHSAAPLRSAAERGIYIRRIVCHVAARLALETADQPAAAAVASASSSPSPPAHILLLHIDAQSLLGAPRCSSDDPEHASAALAFVDQLLAALMTQLSSSAPPASEIASTAGAAAALSAYPPPPPSAAASSFVVAPPLLSPCASAAPTAPLHAAAQLFESASLCSTLLWSCVLDDSEGSLDALGISAPIGSSGGHGSDRESVAAAATSASSLRLSVLQSLRPLQSSRVQDGCIAAPSTRWFNCAAFIFHADSTRVSSAAEPVAAAASPLLPTHGSVHVAHFMRELLFKLGLGVKYGA